MNAQRREDRGSSARRLRPGPSAGRGDGRPAGRGGTLPTPNGSKLFDARAWAALSRSLHLSNREQQLLRGVFDDWTDPSIAAALGISRHTVHTHFERLHQKLGVDTRAKLILRVVDEFLALTASPASSLPPICPHRAGHGCRLWKAPAAV